MNEPIEQNDIDRMVSIDYTNYQGIRATRTIRPISIFFGHNQWHPRNQWFLEAWDYERKATRHFAMADIHEWTS